MSPVSARLADPETVRGFGAICTGPLHTGTTGAAVRMGAPSEVTYGFGAGGALCGRYGAVCGAGIWACQAVGGAALGRGVEGAGIDVVTAGVGVDAGVGAGGVPDGGSVAGTEVGVGTGTEAAAVTGAEAGVGTGVEAAADVGAEVGADAGVVGAGEVVPRGVNACALTGVGEDFAAVIEASKAMVSATTSRNPPPKSHVGHCPKESDRTVEVPPNPVTISMSCPR